MIFDSQYEDHATIHKQNLLQIVPEEYPYNLLHQCIGIIIYGNNNRAEVGTGFLISSKYVLTAAHIFKNNQFSIISQGQNSIQVKYFDNPPLEKYESENKIERSKKDQNDEEIRFEGREDASFNKSSQRPNNLANKQSFGKNKMQISSENQMRFYLPSKKRYYFIKSFVPEPYSPCNTNFEKVHYDFSLCLLQQPVVNEKYLQLTYLPNQNELKDIPIQIYGYPNNPIKSIADTDFKKSMGEIHHTKKNLFYYQLSTEKGMSGSPIICWQGNNASVVGIHSSYSYTQRYNTGVRINRQVYQELKVLSSKITDQQTFPMKSFQLFEMLEKEKQLEEATKYEQKLRKQFHFSQNKQKLMKLYKQISVIRFYCGKYKEAAVYFRYLMKEGKRYCESYYFRCILHLREKENIKELQQYIESVVKNVPQNGQNEPKAKASSKQNRCPIKLLQESYEIMVYYMELEELVKIELWIKKIMFLIVLAFKDEYKIDFSYPEACLEEIVKYSYKCKRLLITQEDLVNILKLCFKQQKQIDDANLLIVFILEKLSQLLVCRTFYPSPCKILRKTIVQESDRALKRCQDNVYLKNRLLKIVNEFKIQTQ